MKNNEILKKQIIYRSTHRGSKEMDMLLGIFVKKYIKSLNYKDLNDLKKILDLEDEILHQWYFNKINNNIVSNTKVSELLKNFKL